MIVSLSLILYDTGLRMRCQQIVTHYLTVSCVPVASVLRMSVNGIPHLTSLTISPSQTTSLLRCDASDTRFSPRLSRYIITRPIWGNPDLSPSYTWLQKFMLFFRVESVDFFLLFLFSLLYIVYHRPSTELQCSLISLYIVHDS